MMKLDRRFQNQTLVLYDDGSPVLGMREDVRDTRVTMYLSGRLVSSAEHELQDELNTLMLLGMDIQVDLREVTTVASACAEVFLNVQLAMDAGKKGRLTLVNVPDHIWLGMKETGLSELIRIRRL